MTLGLDREDPWAAMGLTEDFLCWVTPPLGNRS